MVTTMQYLMLLVVLHLVVVTSIQGPWYITSDGTDTDKCGHTLNEACRTLLPIWRQVTFSTKSKVNIFTNTDFSISNMKLHPHDGKWHNMSIKPLRAEPVHVDILNTTIQWLCLYLDNHQVSLFVQNTTFKSAGIHVEPSIESEHQSVHIENCTFKGTVDRPVLYVRNTRNVTVKQTIFSDKVTHISVKLIQVQSSSLCFNNCRFTNMTESERIISMYGSTVTVENTEFTGNEVEQSVTYCLDRSMMSLINVTMANNKGNFIAAESCTVNILSSRFINNSHIRGADWNSDGSTLTITDSTFAQNSGGVIAAKNSTIMIQNTEFGDNECSKDGGVIYAYFKTSMDITDSFFMRNRATGSNGGAIFIENECQLKIKDTKFHNNTAMSGGGAVMVLDHSEYNDSRSHFLQNIASDAGGAIAVLDHSTMTLTGSNFSYNKAMSLFDKSNHQTLNCPPGIEQEHDGGAIILQTYSTATITRCHFTGNQASDDAGAIYVKRRSNMEIDNSSFENNSAEDSGGSIVVHTSDIIIHFSRFHKESVSFGFGGSICVLDVGNVSIQHNSFTQCRAAFGGSISVMSESVVNIEHSAINESFSNTTAGAVYINHNSFMKANNLSVHNSMSNSGGAITCKESKINLDNGMVKGNKALSSDGGGLNLESCEAIIDNFIFILNSALQYGGGLFATSSIIEMHNSKASRNRVGKKGGFILITDKSQLTSQDLELGINTADITGSNIAVVNNSAATIRHLHRLEIVDGNNTLCPMIVHRSSKMIVVSLYHTNNSYDIKRTEDKNESCAFESTDVHVCTDNSSLVEGVTCSEPYPESCDTQCRCYSDRHEMVLVADCSHSDLTTLPASLSDDLDWLLLSENNISSLETKNVSWNLVSKLDLSANTIKQMSSDFLDLFEQLSSLDITNNELTTLPRTLQNMTSLQKIWISGNSFQCSCENLWLRDWVLNNTDLIQDYETTQCQMESGDWIPITQMNELDMGCVNQFPTWAIKVMVILVLLVFFLIVVAVRKYDEIKFQLFLRYGVKFEDKVDNVEDATDLDYDAFISYNLDDHHWVMENVSGILEKHDYSCCFEGRDFVPGYSIQKNISTAIKHSRRMIAVVTRSYVDNKWCVEEFMQAHAEALGPDRRFFILLLLDDFDVGNLPEEIQAHVKAKRFIDAKKREKDKDIELFRKRLLYAMPKVPLKYFPRNDNMALRAMRFPPLYNRIHTYGVRNERENAKKAQIEEAIAFVDEGADRNNAVDNVREGDEFVAAAAATGDDDDNVDNVVGNNDIEVDIHQVDISDGVEESVV